MRSWSAESGESETECADAPVTTTWRTCMSLYQAQPADEPAQVQVDVHVETDVRPRPPAVDASRDVDLDGGLKLKGVGDRLIAFLFDAPEMPYAGVGIFDRFGSPIAVYRFG